MDNTVSIKHRIAESEKSITAAMWQMQEALEQLAVDRLIAIQKRNTLCDVSFACAMGAWSFYRTPKKIGRYYNPGADFYDDPILERTFRHVLSEYGWGCIPIVALSIAADGMVERRTDW